MAEFSKAVENGAFRGTCRRLRVIHVAATASGAHWMYEILVGLRERGYEVGAVIAGEDGDLAVKLRESDIPFWICNLSVASPWDLIGLSRKVLALARLLRRLRPDIVQYHLFDSVILGRPAAWLAGVPLRFSMITGPIYLEAPAPRAVDLGTSWMDTAIISSCRWVQEEYRRSGLGRPVELVYYGADPRQFDPERADGLRVRKELGLAPERPVVGLVAHFYPPLPPGPWTPVPLWNRGVKGHETLLRAVPYVREEFPEAMFILVGKGWGREGERYKAEVEDMARALGVGDAVVFTGFRSDIPDVLAAVDVAVQCSLSENLGGTIEALLMGRPTVATAVGGMVDAIIDHETGLLVPADDPPALAGAIRALLRDPAWARDLGQRGREWALQNFTIAKTVDDLDRIYGEYWETAVPLGISRFVSLGVHLLRPIVRVGWVAMSAAARRGLWKAVGVLARMHGFLKSVAKRVVDLVLSIAALALLSPLMVLVALVIRLSMGKPILFRQVRAGLHGRPFVLLKFRTMSLATDSKGNLLDDGLRLTSVGEFLRRVSWDELPQLFNVLKGDMSVVGPRPLPVDYMPLFSSEQATRFRVKPGITGLAVVRGRNLLSWEERLNIDAWYAQNWTFWLDLKIILATIWKVLKQEGISHPGHPTMPPFRGGTP